MSSVPRRRVGRETERFKRIVTFSGGRTRRVGRGEAYATTLLFFALRFRVISGRDDAPATSPNGMNALLGRSNIFSSASTRRTEADESQKMFELMQRGSRDGLQEQRDGGRRAGRSGRGSG